MELLDMDLLDFSVEEEDGNETEEKSRLNGLGLGLYDPNDPSRPLLELPEEDLEWITNKDAFPQIDAFVEMIPNCQLEEHPPASQKQRSPVSVLEAASNCTLTTSGSNSSGSTGIGTSYCWLGSTGFTVPVKGRSKRDRTKRRGANFRKVWDESPRRKAVTAGNAAIIGRKCQHCGSEKTPQWRAGPAGPKTLCNACGVRYKSGRLVPEYRPASSPTYSAEVHSNSHRKILEMRRRQFERSTDTPADFAFLKTEEV